MRNSWNNCTYQTTHMVNQRMLTPGLLWGPPLLFHLTAWDQNIQQNKNRSLMYGKDDSTAVSSKLREPNMWDFSVVCALLLKLCWDQRLTEALIRGRAVSQVSYEPGPPTRPLFDAQRHLDQLRNCITNFKRQLLQLGVGYCRMFSNNDTGGAMVGLVWWYFTLQDLASVYRVPLNIWKIAVSHLASLVQPKAFKHYQKEMTAAASCLCVREVQESI